MSDKNIMMNKELIECNLNGNARGKPVLKLRDGPALKKMKGVTDLKLKIVAFYTGSGFKNLYRKENLLREGKGDILWVRKPGNSRDKGSCLLHKPGNGNTVHGKLKVVKDLCFN